MQSILRGAAVSVMVARVLASDRSTIESGDAEVAQNPAGATADRLCAGYRVATETALVPASKEARLETVDSNSDDQADLIVATPGGGSACT